MRVQDVIVAIDPGRDKCGVALVGLDGSVLMKAVVAPGGLTSFIRQHADAESRRRVVAYALGDGTAQGTVRDKLIGDGISPEDIHSIDEAHSSEIGRRAYWRARPPRGWRKLIPVGLQVPPEPYDDFVAVELARRFLSGRPAGGERTL